MMDVLLDCAAAVVLGVETADGLPRVAAEVLAQGINSPALCALAAMDEPRAEEAFSILERVLKEAGTKLPTQREAALRLARKTAQEMLKGEVLAYEGSRQIWALARRVTSESMDDLDPFIYAASEWEDRPEDRSLLEDAMLVAARELTSTSKVLGLCHPN
jgi:hypothetical protein